MVAGHAMTDFRNGREPVQRELLGLLRAAADRDLFVVFAEPVAGLADSEPRKHELTLRLPAGDGRLISPAAFHPVAGRFGLMPELDDLLIRRAVALAGHGHAVAVDVHGASLGDPDFARRTEEAMADGHADPALLTFELSEEALISNGPVASAFAQRMHELGVAITGDHFGTCSAGFGHLKRLPLDALKIDASFVTELRSTPSDEQFVRAFVHLARGLRVATAADGVVDEATRLLLADAGVDEGQGTRFGPPAALPADGRAPLSSPLSVVHER